MSQHLPKHINPAHLCDVGSTLRGEIPLKDMLRLSDLLSNREGVVLVELRFAKDSQGFRNICGKITTSLGLECQRCLQPMSHLMYLTIKLSPVTSEAAVKQLPIDYDPLMVKNESVLVLELVEDELLLNMPIVLRHEPEKCKGFTLKSEETKKSK